MCNGNNATKPIKRIRVVWVTAFKIASRTMQKILNIISVISFVLVAAITGGGVFGYLWITNEDNQKMLQDKAMEKVMGAIKIPGLSGPALPTGALTPGQQKNEEKKALKFSNPF